MRRVVAGSALAVVLLLGPATAAVAQVPPTGVPTQDIIPEPNSGRAPEESGDRGGALQLAVFGVVVAALVGGGLHLARQARRAKASG